MGGSKENREYLSEGAFDLPDVKRVGGAKKMNEVHQNNRRALCVIDQNTMGSAIHPNALKRKGCSRRDVLHEPNPLLAEAVIRRNPEETEEDTVLVVEDCKDYNGDSVPIFVRHTEAFLDEIDRMDVDETDDVEDPIVDIDSSDLKNPLAVVEYVDDIYAFYRRIEGLRTATLRVDSYIVQISSCVSPGYMDGQSDINDKMRAILIDWLLEVHYKFKLMDETLYLTVNVIDRFLERQSVSRKKLQLVGSTAMLLACKYEEVTVPVVDDFIMISDNAYTRREVLEMEKLMLNTLQFNMSIPTPYVFMRRFLKAAQSDKKLELLAFFIVELCLVEYKMLKFPPSLVAAAAIYTAQCSLCQFRQWTKASEWHTSYSEDQLKESSRLMVILHEKAATGKLTGVYRKYSTLKFDEAAKAEPALFLLDH